MARTNASVVKEYFGVTNTELLDLKRHDDSAIATLANGIKDNTLNY